MKEKATKRIIIFLIIIIHSIEGFCQVSSRIDSIVTRWTKLEILRHASVGVYFQDTRTGEILASANHQLSLIPASILKLFTTASALEIMGPDYRFITKLAYSGEIRNDSLMGDLIIIGGGDPVLGSKYFKDHYLKPHFLAGWSDTLRQHNIRYISGNIITDASIYDDLAVPDTWIWQDIGNYYGAGACGLSVYDNSFDIHMASPPETGKPVKILSTAPAIPGLVFDNRVVSSNVQLDRANVFGSPFDSLRVIRGTIPKGRTDFVIRASIPDPPYLLAQQLKDIIETAGIKVEGKIKAKGHRPGYPLVVVATTVSPPLIDIISVINHESVNMFAEHLLKHLAWLKTGVGTTDEGTRVVIDFWKSKGIDMEGFFMHDGSGLSRFNALTVRQMSHMLSYMRNKSEYGDLFFISMPTVPNGTLYYFSPNSFPGNSLYAKSGSMTRVRCYAGLLSTASNREILFTIMLNNFSCSQNKATKAIEKLLAEIYRDYH